jgi:hypothetical protein
MVSAHDDPNLVNNAAAVYVLELSWRDWLTRHQRTGGQRHAEAKRPPQGGIVCWQRAVV